MKLFICGIGGAGGRIARNFLKNVDLDVEMLSKITKAEHVSPGRVKGIWLESYKSDVDNQKFFKDLNQGGYPCFFIPQDIIPDSCELRSKFFEEYGYNIKKQGFVRDAQYLKAIFEIFETNTNIQMAACEDKYIQKIACTMKGRDAGNEVSNPIFDCAWEAIRPYTSLGGGDCNAILFIVSFGGGTGTGFINPIVDHIRAGGRTDFPVFVLGIFTDPGDLREAGQVSLEGQRYLAAISSLYDLITKGNVGATGIILIDNQILKKRAGSDRPSQNKFIYEVIKPMVVGKDYPDETPDATAQDKEFQRGLDWSPIFVPYYWSQPSGNDANKEEVLVERALNEGMLFESSYEKADKAFVFCRGFIDAAKIMQAISAKTGLAPIRQIQVYRKIGEKNDEILILMRNPYGDDAEAYKNEGTFENKFCKVIKSALKYMNSNVNDLFYEGEDSQKAANAGEEIPVKLTPTSRKALEKYYFGDEGYIKNDIGKTGGLAFRLKEAREKLKAGNKPNVEPLFTVPLRIFPKSQPGPSFDKDQSDVESRSRKANDEDWQDIVKLVDQRIKERLSNLGLISNKET